jgi:hypothetical protein
MNSQLIEWGNPPTQQRLRWFCPACQLPHEVPVRANHGDVPVWHWNGETDRPSLSPSVRISFGDVPADFPHPRLCHCFLTAGNVHFCGDSKHALAGMTVPLPEIPEGHRL